MAASIEDDALWDRLGPEIIRDLDDDEPRLRAAQTLEMDSPESPRARLIRLQVRLASLEGGMDHPEWFRMAAEARRLVLQSEGEWLPELVRRLDPSDVVFHRGFAESIALDVRQLLNQDLVRHLWDATLLRHLTLFGVSAEIDLYTAIKLLHETGLVRRLRSLQVDGQEVDDASLNAIIDLRWPTLRWLSLRHNRIGFAGVQRLALATSREERLPELRYVRLDGNPVDPVELVHEEQGVVVQTTIPQIQRELPAVPWLRRIIRNGRVVEADRFAHRPTNIDRG